MRESLICISSAAVRCAEPEKLGSRQVMSSSRMFCGNPIKDVIWRSRMYTVHQILRHRCTRGSPRSVTGISVCIPCARAIRIAWPIVTCAALRESKACKYKEMQHSISTAVTGSRHKRLVSGRSCSACTKKSAPGGLGAWCLCCTKVLPKAIISKK
jgi:hypothetical protein